MITIMLAALLVGASLIISAMIVASRVNELNKSTKDGQKLDTSPFTLDDVYEAVLVDQSGERIPIQVSRARRLYSNFTEAQAMINLPMLFTVPAGDRMVLVPEFIFVEPNNLKLFGRATFDYDDKKIYELIVHTSPGFLVYHKVSILHLDSIDCYEEGVLFNGPILYIHPEPVTLRTAAEVKAYIASMPLGPIVGGWIIDIDDYDFQDEDEDDNDDDAGLWVY